MNIEQVNAAGCVWSSCGVRDSSSNSSSSSSSNRFPEASRCTFIYLFIYLFSFFLVWMNNAHNAIIGIITNRSVYEMDRIGRIESLVSSSSSSSLLQWPLIYIAEPLITTRQIYCNISDLLFTIARMIDR